jgi:predicted metal-binding membrane protein
VTSTRSHGVTVALVFAISAAVTVIWCGSMSAMPGMEMPGGWTMSMAWMRMPGQSWAGAIAIFLGMWMVMTVAMMLPVVSPVLLRHRCECGRSAASVALGYFSAWMLAGLALYPLGVGAAALAMRIEVLSTAMPLIAGAAFLAVGASQLTSWKSRQLEDCARLPPGGSPVQRGWRLGWRCVACCAGPTALLVICGVMDLRVMTVVAAGIALERLAPRAQQWARVSGCISVTIGLLIFARVVSFT